MNPRPSATFLAAVLALLVAVGGTGYAAGLITSRDIKDGTIASRDIKDGTVTSGDLGNGAVTGPDVRRATLTGTHLRDRSVPRTKLGRACAATETRAFGGCIRLAASGPSSFQAAVDDCNRRNGRLPSTLELTFIATRDQFGWADGNPSQYEFSGDYTGVVPFTPIALDRVGNPVQNASGQFFWHHCVTY